MTTQNKIEEVLKKLPHKRKVSFALHCAKDCLKYLREEDKEACSGIIKTVELWLEGNATLDEIKHVVSASSSAYTHSYAASYTSFYAVSSSAYAASSATSSAAAFSYAASAVSSAATSAAFYAASSAAASAAAFSYASAASAASSAVREEKMKEYLKYLVNSLNDLTKVLLDLEEI